MKRTLCLLWFALLLGLFPLTAGAEESPVLALTQIPKLGEEARFEGQIYRQSADIDPAAYRVAVYIQPGDNYPCYYKPYDGANLPPLNAETASDGYIMGLFSLAAYTDGPYSENDRNSKYVHLMILPATENPLSDNYAEMAAKALEVVTVTRTAGGVTVSPKHEPKDFGSPPPPPPRPGLEVSPDKIMLDVGFHSDGSAIGSALTEAHIRKCLEKLVSFTNAVRFYDCSTNLRPAYEIAHELGFPYVIATAYLTSNDAANKAELDRAADLLNSGLVSICAVGNETLHNGVLTAEQLAAYIAYLREKVTVENVFFTTADTVQALLNNKAARDACDFLFAHDYPYYGGVDPDKQLAALKNDYNDLKATDSRPDFQVYIGETGYPTAGETYGKAVANGTEAARYFAEVREWSVAENVPTFAFEAFDESAKQGKEAEKHFGLFDGDLKLKPAYGKLPAFQSIAAVLYGNSLTLRGNVGVNFYLKLPDALTSDAAAYVTLNGAKLLIKDAPYDADKELYSFAWTVPAKQMNDAVTLQVYSGAGYPYLLLDRNGVDFTDGFSYSVASYLKLAREQNPSGALRELVDAMSDYGSLAQTFFRYDAANAAPLVNDVSSVSAESFAPYQPQIAVTPNSGVSYVGSNLKLESETTLRHYFKLDAGRALNDYEFIANGESVTPTPCAEGYFVEIADIAAKDLGKPYAVAIRAKSGADALKIDNYSALSYGWKALNCSSNDESLWNLVKGLYLYNQKARAYFA